MNRGDMPARRVIRDGTPPPARMSTGSPSRVDVGGARLPDQPLAEAKDPVRFNTSKNQIHRFREDSPVRRADDREQQSEGPKSGGKGQGGKEKGVNKFNNWWVRKDAKRGSGRGGKDGKK